jgi:hypothetical protein
MGMSYEEFWQKDYRLVESFIKRNDITIEQQTDSNFELVNYVREALLEITSMIYKDPKKSTKPHKFPEKPIPRTRIGALKEKRNKQIDREIKDNYKQRMMDRKK